MTLWRSGMAECRVCTHRWAAVIEVIDDKQEIPDMECPKCGAMAGEYVGVESC